MNRSDLRRAAAGLAAALALVAVAACGRSEAEPASGGTSGRGRPGGGADRVVSVEAVPVERGSIARSVTVSGIVEPIRTIAVNSRLSGALLSVNVEEGSVVRRGDVLARVDDRELQAQLAAAKAQYDVAKAALDRSTRLRQEKVITEPEFERDRTAFAAAKASLEQIQTRISYATVQSPIDGVVTEKLVEQGDALGVQAKMFSVADVSTMVVRVGVSELDVGELRAGDVVDLGLDALPQRALQGRIRRVFPSGDPNTRLVTVEVALSAEARQAARPGYLARATFALNARNGVLLVPAAAIVSGAGSQSVFVVQEGKALRRSVSTGLTSNGKVEIVSGLDEGEVVVTAGNNNLRDGTSVRVTERTDKPLESAPAVRGEDG